MDDTKEYRRHTCYHCGNKGLMKIEATHCHTYGGPIYDEYDNEVDFTSEEFFEWSLLSCPVCHNVTLLEEHDTDPNFQAPASKMLYPQSSVNYTEIPEKVQSAFEAALKVKNIDRAICLQSLRRVLEVICKDKGANGKDLFEMGNDMIKRQILPKMFDDACWVIRELGNSAAHGDDKVFYDNQVEETIQFVRTIIEYLYVLPGKMKEMREELESEKGKAHVSTDDEANVED